MKDEQTFKLIDGNFSASESLEILSSVFSSKIQFHQMKNFSSQERFGHDDEVAVIRIPQLKNSLEEIVKLIASIEKEDQRLEIKSDIVVHFVPTSKYV